MPPIRYSLQNEDVNYDPTANTATAVQRYTPPATPSPATPTPTANASADYTIKTPEQFAKDRTAGVDENAIRENTRKNMQSVIDAIDAQYANLVGNQQQVNESNLGQTRAIDARSGLQGSDFGQAHMAGQQDANSKALKALEDEKALKIAGVNQQINQSAKDEIAAQKLLAVGNADAYSKYLSDAQTKAQGSLKTLGESGTTVEELKQKSPDTLAYLQKALGMTDFQLQQELSNASNGKLKTDTKIDGNTAHASVFNPVTGTFELHSQQFDVQDGQLVDMGGGKFLVAHIDPTTGKKTYEDAVPAKPTEVGPGGSLVDPATGKVIYKAPFSPSQLGSDNSVDGSGLNTKDRAVFNSLVDKANKSPLLAAADRTIVLKNSIDQAKKDPSNGAVQLNLAYSYVQALDTYQSSVREGELNLVNSVDSKIGKLQNSVQQIQNGQIVRPEVAKEIADAAEQLVNTINQGAQAKDKQYAAQAKVNGTAVEKAWKDYRASFTSNYDNPNKDLQGQLQPGEILVQDAQGNIGAIPQGEFDASKYTKVQQ